MYCKVSVTVQNSHCSDGIEFDAAILKCRWYPVVHFEKIGPVQGEEVGKLLEFGVRFKNSESAP